MYNYPESTQLIRSLWRFVRPEEVQQLKERRVYANDCKRLKQKVRERREKRGEDLSLRKLARGLGINENTFCSALVPSAVDRGNRNHGVLFRALSELRMQPSGVLKEKYDWIKYRSWGNSSI